MRVVGYSYDAAIYCADCAELTDGEDSEGNPVHAIVSCSDDASSVCDNCGLTLLGNDPLAPNYHSGEVEVWLNLCSVGDGRTGYAYRVEMAGKVIAKGYEFEAPSDWSEEKAVASLLGFLADADADMHSEQGWTFDSDELANAAYLDDAGNFEVSRIY